MDSASSTDADQPTQSVRQSKTPDPATPSTKSRCYEPGRAFCSERIGVEVEHNRAEAVLVGECAAATAPTSPMTGSGKIQKFKLRDDWAARDWTEL